MLRETEAAEIKTGVGTNFADNGAVFSYVEKTAKSAVNGQFRVFEVVTGLLIASDSIAVFVF